MSARIDDIESGMKSHDDDRMDHYFTDVKMLRVSREQIESINSLIQVTKDQNQKISNLTAATEKLLEETKAQGRTSRRLTWISLGLSILAVLIAGMAVVFAIRDSASDTSWMAEQIEILSDIHDEIRQDFDE